MNVSYVQILSHVIFIIEIVHSLLGFTPPPQKKERNNNNKKHGGGGQMSVLASL